MTKKSTTPPRPRPKGPRVKWDEFKVATLGDCEATALPDSPIDSLMLHLAYQHILSIPIRPPKSDEPEQPAP